MVTRPDPTQLGQGKHAPRSPSRLFCPFQQQPDALGELVSPHGPAKQGERAARHAVERKPSLNFAVSVAGQQHCRQPRPVPPPRADQRQPVRARHGKVGQQNVHNLAGCQHTRRAFGSPARKA